MHDYYFTIFIMSVFIFGTVYILILNFKVADRNELIRSLKFDVDHKDAIIKTHIPMAKKRKRTNS